MLTYKIKTFDWLDHDLNYLFLMLSTVILLQLGIDTVPVLVCPLPYLLLLKPAKGVKKSFPLLFHRKDSSNLQVGIRPLLKTL